MKRHVYLKQPDVKEFVEWFANAIDDKTIKHQYQQPYGRGLSLNGLPDALKRYDWRFKLALPGSSTVKTGSSFTDNSKALTALQKGLTSGVNAHNDLATLSWSIAVMEWGGVRHGNVAWLTSNGKGLAKYIDSAAKTLNRGDDSLADLGKAISRFNSGMSKVYSLVANDWVIYDSRVAAALSWFVALWCVQTNRTSVPNGICFPCMRPKEGSNKWKSRNPSCGNFHFPWMSTRKGMFAHWNMRASWIIGAAVALSGKHSTFGTARNPSRALEAALFMWGYDLSSSPVCTESAKKTSARTPTAVMDVPPVADAPEWRAGVTQGGRQREFQWRIDDDRQVLLLKRFTKPEQFAVSGLFLLVHRIYDEFGFDWFPLANNVTKLMDGTEKLGLGVMIHEIFRNVSKGKSVSNGQAASQIGVILQYIGIFESNNLMRGIEWRLRVSPPADIEELRVFLNDGKALSGEI